LITITGFDPKCYPNYLYINQGDGTFAEQAVAYGVANLGCGLATALTDYDRDGDIDIMVANDFGPWHISNTLYQNNYPAVGFSNFTVESGFEAKIYGMGIAIGDINNDLNYDYYVTNLGRNILLLSNGDGMLTDITTSAGVEDEFVNDLFTTGWGSSFLDYNNDGYVDLFVNNGWIPTGAEFVANAENNPNRMFRNNGDNTFTDITEDSGVGYEQMGRGSACFDYDNDGDLDMISVAIKRDVNAATRVQFYENNDDNVNMVYDPDVNLLLTVEEDISQVEFATVICNENPTLITLSKTTVGTSYYLYNLSDAAKVGEMQISEGNPLTFSTGTVQQNTNYQIRLMQNGLTLALDTVIQKIVTPLQPQITMEDSLLTSSEGISYKWFRDGELISTDRAIVAVESGEYWVDVVDTYGCTGTSESQFVQIVTGLEKTMLEGITIYPNPSNGRFEITYPHINDKVSFRLYNSIGQQVVPVIYVKENKNLTINITQHPAGLYFLKIVTGKRSKSYILSKYD